MTLQDYLNLSLDSLRSLLNSAGPVIVNVVAAAVTLIVGIIVGTILKRILEEILKAINFEKMASGWNVYQVAVKAHDGVSATEFFGELLRWVTVLVFLLPAIAALNISGAPSILSRMMGYIPNIVLASFFLILGFVFAWFLHRAVVIVGSMVGAPHSHFVANIAYLATVVFALLQSLMVLGVAGDILKNAILLSLAAAALATALGGKESFSAIVKRFFDATR
jgi:hypothetical protein